MSTIDFNKPITTDLYTAWPTEIQAAQLSLAAMLDPNFVTTISNPVAGAKRWSGGATGLVQAWSGSAWATAPTGYFLRDGSNLITGAAITANAISFSSQDTGATARRLLLLNGSNEVYVGDVDNALAGHSLHLAGHDSLSFEVNSIVRASLSTIALNSGLPLQFSSAAGQEQIRLVNNAAYVAFWNSANSTRTGYLQGNTGSDLSLVAENGAKLQFGTASSIKMVLDPTGNLGLNVFPSAWGLLSAIEGTGGALAFNGSAATYLTQNIYFNGSSWVYKASNAASVYIQSSGQHQWYCVPSGGGGGTATLTANMALDGTGNNLMLGTGTPSYSSAGRGVFTVGGTSALLALQVSGVSCGYVYHTGTQMQVSADVGPLSLAIGGANKVTVNTNGSTVFTGAAATTPNKPGSVSGAVSLNAALSNVHEITLNGNMTSLTLSNLSDGQTLNLFITQDGTGSRTMAGLTNANGYVWPGGVAGVLSTAAGSVDLLVMTYRASSGKVYCTLAKGFV